MEYLDREDSNEGISGKDIDWFVQIDHYYIHAASAGGIVPAVIRENVKSNEVIAQAVREMPFQFEEEDIIINPYLHQILHLDEQQVLFVLSACNISKENDPIDTYIRAIYGYSFIKFARKGFVSFDKTDINDFDDPCYHWVARPSREYNSEVKLSDVPVMKKSHLKKHFSCEPFDLISFIDMSIMSD